MQKFIRFSLKSVLSIMLVTLVLSCSKKQEEAAVAQPEIKSEPYSKLDNGTEVTQFTLTNSKGMSVSILNYGPFITSLNVPDRSNQSNNVMLDYKNSMAYYTILADMVKDDTNDYQNNNIYCILNKRLKEFTDAELHDCLFWNAEQVSDSAGATLKLTSNQPAGKSDNGVATITFSLNNRNELSITKELTSPKDVAFISMDKCFNLGADPSMYRIQINADRVNESPKKNSLYSMVKGTKFDFTTPRTADLKDHAIFDDLKAYKLIKKNKGELSLAASFTDTKNGRYMEVYTTSDGLLVNSVEGRDESTNDRIKRYLCIETANLMDSTAAVAPVQTGKVYKNTTVYKFMVK